MFQKLIVLFLFISIVGCAKLNKQEQAKVKLEKKIIQRNNGIKKSMELYARGIAENDAGKPSDAAIFFQKSIAVNPRNYHTWMAIGILSNKNRDYKAAIEAFSYAAHLAPDRIEPLYNKGSVLQSVGRYEHAIIAYESARELSSNNLHLIENLARCYHLTNVNPLELKKLASLALQSENRVHWRIWLERILEDLSRENTMPFEYKKKM